MSRDKNRTTRRLLPSFYQQQMHSEVCQNHKGSSEHREADAVFPQGHGFEAEGAEDGGTGDFNVQAVFVVYERQISDFVDDETFEGIVENGELQSS
jgi:hypothetical protein